MSTHSTGQNRITDADLAKTALAAGDPTGWFEQLYTAAEKGEAVIPWARNEPNPELAAWAAAHPGDGRRALVVGSAFGDDPEVLAAAGYATTGFDVAATAVAAAQRRFPDSAVDYRVADLLAPPPEWHHAFDLVVEIINVQAMPRDVRPKAIASVAGFLAPGGTALVCEVAEESVDTAGGPPWPLTRAEVESFAQDGVRLVSIEPIRDNTRWWAEFTR
ncbi:class I SAM-dependent methyltransferase [Amycolatopsis sp. NPDC059021]|uniref:class I SAM-dependent methyltransferase n=1 Tax=Amycolatopsis sp. NPDC059021 TaxID=3346704 RepID=UPI003670B190